MSVEKLLRHIANDEKVPQPTTPWWQRILNELANPWPFKPEFAQQQDSRANYDKRLNEQLHEAASDMTLREVEDALRQINSYEITLEARLEEAKRVRMALWKAKRG